MRTILNFAIALACLGSATLAGYHVGSHRPDHCPEDAVLAWDGATDRHDLCVTWDDATDAPYPTPAPPSRGETQVRVVTYLGPHWY